MKDIQRLKIITSVTAYAVSAIFLIVIPTVYFIIEFNNKINSLNFMAKSISSRLSELIYSSPDSWQFKQYNIEFILSYLEGYSEKLHYIIQDSSGMEVMHDMESVDKAWLHSVTSSLSDGINEVGTLTLAFDIMPLIWQTSLVTVFAFVMATAMYFILRLLPFAQLEKTMSALASSRELLSKEVEAKNIALDAQKRISAEMEFQSLHDALTQLPNRKQFNQTIHSLIHNEQTGIAGRFCVMLLDLDRFKEINDALGHQLGDQVLIELANRLTRVLPEAELIARLGGDEYAILIKAPSDDVLKRQLKSVEEGLKKHFNLEGLFLTVEASIGVAYFPEHGATREVLVRHADVAMYHAKNSGRAWALYDEKFDSNTPDRLRLVSDLRHALDNDELSLHYQPKMCLKTEKIVSLEALARWQHPEYGMIAPDVFIPMAEQSNLINALTTWLIDTALKQLKELQETYSETLSMAVNISANNLQDATLSERLIEKLTEYAVVPEFLTLEITETMMMQDPEHSRLVIQGLSDLGIKIAIDDFGTGYSSLSYLKRLAVDQVKIDRSFTMNMMTDQDDQIIVKSTINLAHSLGIEVVAEGIEEAQAVTLLQELGCEYGQGYFICKPMSGDLLLDWLQQFDFQTGLLS